VAANRRKRRAGSREPSRCTRPQGSVRRGAGPGFRGAVRHHQDSLRTYFAVSRVHLDQVASVTPYSRPAPHLAGDRVGKVGSARADLILDRRALGAAGADLAVIQEHVNTRSPMGRFIFTLFSALAQLEREQIAERTSTAMLRHQSKGRRMTRPDRCTGLTRQRLP
jgi:hypothetical protein